MSQGKHGKCTRSESSVFVSMSARSTRNSVDLENGHTQRKAAQFFECKGPGKMVPNILSYAELFCRFRVPRTVYSDSDSDSEESILRYFTCNSFVRSSINLKGASGNRIFDCRTLFMVIAYIQRSFLFAV